MKDYRVDFRKMNWESGAPGMRFKAMIKDGKKIRLLELSHEYVEKDWCTKGHLGYVLEGRCAIDFAGKLTEFKKGDGLFIPKGEASKHKPSVAKGEKVLFIMVEDV